MAGEVLIVFYSRSGATERLATAAAVGAVQGRAGIRLRRLPDPPEAVEASSCREALDRMLREYVAPSEADVLWAGALVFGAPADYAEASGAWAPYLDLLAGLRSRGRLGHKVGAVVGAEPGRSACRETLARLGLAPLEWAPGAADAIAEATALGRRVAEAVRRSPAGGE